MDNWMLHYTSFLEFVFCSTKEKRK